MIDKIKQEVKNIKDVGVKVYRRWRVLSSAARKHYKVCAICGYTKKLQAHHIQPRHLFPDLILVWKNIIVLCKNCHFQVAHWHNYRDYNSDIIMIGKLTTVLHKNQKILEEKK